MKTVSRAWICLLALCFAACSPSPQQDRDAYTIAVIPKGTTHEFWRSVHAGAVKAQRELADQGVNIRIIWQGPLREDNRDQQIQVVENFMTRRVSGIVLAPLDSQALVAPVETALRSDIPVVIIDSALNSDQFVSFVATDNFKGGQLAAESLGEMLGGRGNVIMLRYAVGSASTEEREAGFLDVMQSRFPDIRLISTSQYAGATRESAYAAAQNLLNRHGREVDGLFAPCEPVTIGLLMALRDIGRAGGDVKLVGFDAGSQPLEGLKAGDIQALVVQNPVQMGYLGVMTTIRHLRGEPVEKRIDTGVHVVTDSNMAEPAIHALIHPPLDEYLR